MYLVDDDPFEEVAIILLLQDLHKLLTPCQLLWGSKDKYTFLGLLTRPDGAVDLPHNLIIGLPCESEGSETHRLSLHFLIKN